MRLGNQRTIRSLLSVVCVLGVAMGVGALSARRSLPDIARTRSVSLADRHGPRVARVENGGLLFTDNPVGVSGTDCGYSLPIGDRTLWFFGDMFLLAPTDPNKPYVGGVSNGALTVPAGTGPEPLKQYAFLTDPKTGLARPVLQNAPGEDSKTRLWPFGSWYDAAARTAYLYYAVVRVTGKGAFDFRIEGHGLASAEVSQPATIQFHRLPGRAGGPLWWPNEKGLLFGAAVVSGTSDPYLYVVGLQEREGWKYGKMARVLKSRIADPDAYEYYSGPAPTWSHNIADAADIEGLRDFPNELSIAYNPYLHGYLAVHSVLIADRIRLCLAPHPWGPYKTLADIGAPHQAFAQANCYAGKEHPELAQNSGRILYVTYVDSQRYWLQLLKITLAK